MDTYRNFQELARHERAGEDYAILCRELAATVAVVAPHGGGIEPGSQAIALALAGDDFAFYAFSGIKKTGNGRLHLTSNRFDEPLGLRIAGQASVVVAVHGNGGEGEAIFLGGRDEPLKRRLLTALTAAGFRAEISDIPGIRGISPDNICNRGRSGAGVQLEICRGLREKMFDNFPHRGQLKKTAVFYALVKTIKETLLRAIEDLPRQGPKRRS